MRNLLGTAAAEACQGVGWLTKLPCGQADRTGFACHGQERCDGVSGSMCAPITSPNLIGQYWAMVYLLQ